MISGIIGPINYIGYIAIIMGLYIGRSVRGSLTGISGGDKYAEKVRSRASGFNECCVTHKRRSALGSDEKSRTKSDRAVRGSLT